MRLVDSHGHLQAEAFASDAEEVLAAAEAGGLVRLLVPGWDVASSRAARDLAHGHTMIDGAAGVHPHAASSVDDSGWAEVRSLAGDAAVVAVGETGLDYDRLFSPREAQLANLRRHLALAFETGRPAILHCRSVAGQRDAQDDLLAELEAAGFGGWTWADRFGGRPPAILHSFSGPVDYAERALALGGRLFIVVGQAPAMEALRITRVGHGEWVRESLFEVVMDPLIHAPQPPKFIF